MKADLSYSKPCWHLTRDKEALENPLTLIYWGPLCRFNIYMLRRSTHSQDLWRVTYVQSLLFLGNIMRRPTSACSHVIRAALWSAHAQWRHSRWVMNAGLLAPASHLVLASLGARLGPQSLGTKTTIWRTQGINVKWIRETYEVAAVSLNDSGFWSFL